MRIQIQMTLSSNENLESIEKKIEKVNAAKQQFEKKVLSKIGDALLSELFTLRSGEDSSISSQKNAIQVKIPSEIRSFLEEFNDNGLIIETAILYFFYNINKLTREFDSKYQENKQVLIEKSSNVNFVPESDNFHDSFTGMKELIINYYIPDYINGKFSMLGMDFERIIIYGVLAILKWLNLLNSSHDILFNEHELFFLDYIKKFN